MDWKNNFIFFGSATIAVSLLNKLILNNFFPRAVVTTRPKAAGRGLKMPDNIFTGLCRSHTVPLIEIDSFKKNNCLKLLEAHRTEYALLLAFGKIIPQPVLDLYPMGIVNIHPSLLPKYRGPSPLQTALLRGDKTTGVSLIRLDNELDHGDILTQKKLAINDNDLYADLESGVVRLAVDLITESMPPYLHGQLHPVPQNHSAATFTKIITKDDGVIDWTSAAGDIYNKFRAFSNWPGSWSFFNKQRLKFVSIKPSTQIAHNSGKVSVHGHQVFVGCADFNMAVDIIQLEGKKPIAAIDFVRGHQNFINYQL